jgi:hypothetical protein
VIVAIVCFSTRFSTFHAVVMDVAGSHVQAGTYGLTSPMTQLAALALMITGYLMGMGHQRFCPGGAFR